jgi:aerobic carbon-monoxide dehydrogenase small subunit
MTPISLTVNGERIAAQVEPRTHLGDFLRDQLRLTGTHLGCEHGVCGACTVLIDGQPARACIAFAVACDGLDVRTIEGFEDDTVMAELRAAFSREHGLQCGFCTPGMLIAARDIVLRVPDADDKRIRVELSGNLCRCTGYLGIVNAVRSVLETRRGAPVAVAVAAPAPASARFTPAESARVVAPIAAREAVPESHKGWTRFEETVVIARPPAVVWAALGDFPMIAACLPGAELLEHDGHSVKGRLNVKLGPMAAAFAGSAVIERHDATLVGTAKGAGGDNASRSRTRGELTYRLTPGGGGTDTRLAITVEYDLQGPLAQFSRSGLAQDLGRRILGSFAANLNARLTGAPPVAAPLGVGRLVWNLLWQRLKALVGLR